MDYPQNILTYSSKGNAGLNTYGFFGLWICFLHFKSLELTHSTLKPADPCCACFCILQLVWFQKGLLWLSSSLSSFVCVCVFITVTNFNSQPFPLVWIIGIYTYQRWFFAAGDPECLESCEYPSYRMWLGNPTRLELPLASRFSSLQLLER